MSIRGIVEGAGGGAEAAPHIPGGAMRALRASVVKARGPLPRPTLNDPLGGTETVKERGMS